MSTKKTLKNKDKFFAVVIVASESHYDQLIMDQYCTFSHKKRKNSLNTTVKIERQIASLT